MNIFDMIFINAKSKETIFSSIYNYLLHPHEQHGLGSLFLDKIIDAIPNEAVVNNLKKYPKFSAIEPECDLGAGLGKIDSIAIFSDEKAEKYFWIATEVKIVDSSANNLTEEGGQLERYVVQSLCQDETVIDIPGKEDFIFIYLVPSQKSKIAITKFQNLFQSKDCSQPSKVFLAFWKNDDLGNDDKNHLEEIPSGNILHKSIEEICKDILEDEALGNFNPVSMEMRYILKSLIGTIRNDFNRQIIPPERGNFLDRMEFFRRLRKKQHRELYLYLEEICGGKRRISNIHTAIGFPYTESPREGDDNTLFRVLTMREYRASARDLREEHYIDGLIIEIMKKKEFTPGIFTKIEKLLHPYAEVHVDKVHPNKKGDQPAVWIEFRQDIDNSDLDKIKSKLDELVRVLRKEFAQYIELSTEY